LLVSDAELARQVSSAFRSYGSLLELSRSPLAATPLISPALVLDEEHPTLDDRGRALRILLRWAVNRLAPSSPPFPLGNQRPFDDPTWSDPLWWHYSILRHAYLEPFHPEFLEGSRPVDKLLELTGIADTESYTQERNRAILEVASLLRDQSRTGAAGSELSRMAIEDYLHEIPRAARALLEIAATFRWVFPRSLLLEMAANERLAGVDSSLSYLVNQRVLLTGDAGASLLTPPGLHNYLLARAPVNTLAPRHNQAARYYSNLDQPVRAAWHLTMAGKFNDAADLLLRASETLTAEGQLDDLVDGLSAFSEKQVSPGRWYQVQTCLGDLHQRLGDRQEAIASYRKALQAVPDPAQQARIYRRMGKLYEDDNQLRALGYYHSAAQSLAPGDPELLDLLKDRAWLRIIRREWGEAEADLVRALEIAPADARRQRADAYHALAGLYRRQARYDSAIPYAQQALNLREEIGDLQRVAESISTLGLIYDEMGDHSQAILVYQEALATFRKLGDREGMGSALLNIGAALYCAERYADAVEQYQESLEIFQSLGLPRAIAQAHQNLSEDYAALGDADAALRHWRDGYTLSLESGLDDQVHEFQALREHTPLLQAAQDLPRQPAHKLKPPGMGTDLTAELLPIEQAALEIARHTGSVTARTLVEHGFTKPTATRHLSQLADRGLLVRAGKGRAVCYTLPASSGRGPAL
jgi:tetratricopeptide (TPR) repeat protein